MILNFSSYHFKILALALCLGIVPTSVLGGILIFDNLNSNTSKLENELVLSTTNAANGYSEWIFEHVRQLEGISSDKQLISETNHMINSDENSPEHFFANFNLETKIGSELEKNPNFLEILICDTDGNVFFTSDISLPNVSQKNESHFQNALSGKIGISDVFLANKSLKNKFGVYENNLPTMLISSPIIGDVGIIGVLTARVDLSSPSSFSFAELDYRSVDSYVVNDENYFVATPKFLETELQKPELKLLASNPLSGEIIDIIQNYNDKGTNVNLIGYSNYNGDEVIGSIFPIEGTDMLYVVEINKNEAFIDIIQLQIFLYSSIGVLFSLIVSISLYFTSNLVTPIKKLKDVTHKVTEGNLDVVIDTKGKGEIHDLSDSFSSMVSSLKESRSLQAQAESKYRNLYEKSPALHRTVNTEGIILDCNESYAKRFGIPKNEIVGTSIFEHVSPEHTEYMKSVFEDWKNSGNVFDTEIWFKTKDGEKFPGLISVNNLYDTNGKLIGSNTLIQDISDFYKTLEAQEERKNVEQEMQQVKHLNKQKDEFLSIVSHELRTPLIPIKGNCEILLDKNFADQLTDDQRKFVESIVSNSKRLDVLIDKILLAQKLDLNKYQFSMSDVNATNLINDIFQSYNSLMKQKNIQFVNSIKDIPKVFCDENALHEVLTNLINNATEFVPPENGMIEVGANTKDGMVEFFVKDNGIGISKEKQERIFDKFYQLDSTHTRTHGGLGLGLAICQKLVKGMDGNIRVMSEEGKGTTFYFSLRSNV